MAACLPLVGADTEVKTGGIVLTLPAPANNFAEAGDKLRTTFFELLVPSTNRLLSAYIPTQKLEELKEGKAAGGTDVYAMVEVPRQAEYSDCTPQAFEQVVKGINPAAFDMKKVGELQEEINIRLKSLDAKSIEVGRPENLGGLFQKTNAFGMAMLAAYKRDGRSVTMATGIAILRVKQKLVFVYLYHRYESPETVAWLSRSLEEWVDAILSRNK